MGCGGSKSSAANAPQTSTKATLLDAATENAFGDTKPVATVGIETFPIFLNTGGAADCFMVSPDNTMLQVTKVQGGPVGVWNTEEAGLWEKVRQGDFVVRVRKAGASDSEWISDDAKKMLEVFAEEGPFQVVIKRADSRLPSRSPSKESAGKPEAFACRDCGASCCSSVAPEFTGPPKKQSAKAEAMLLSVFKYYDNNNDGTLSLKELQAGIAKTGLTMDYMKAADVDGDNKVTKEEFVNFFDPIPDKEIEEIRQWLLEKQSPAATAMLLDVFAKYDKSGDGVLSIAEITKGIEGTGLALEYMLTADKDGDQQVSKEEWLRFFDPIPDKEVEEMRAWLEARA